MDLCLPRGVVCMEGVLPGRGLPGKGGLSGGGLPSHDAMKAESFGQTNT